jgi:hypothetical protein
MHTGGSLLPFFLAPVCRESEFMHPRMRAWGAKAISCFVLESCGGLVGLLDEFAMV